MNTWDAKTDKNQPAVVSALRDANYNVILLHRVGGGVPDLLVTSKRGVLVFLEVKMPGESLNSKEKVFFEKHSCPKYIVYSAEDALKVMDEFDCWGLELMDV